MMQEKENSLIRFEIDETNFISENFEENISSEPQKVEFEILSPIDFANEREVEIYKGLSSIDERLDIITSRVDELNSEIDSLTNHADGLDYAVSVISGIISGIIDSLFVGEIEMDKDKIQELLEKKYHTANDSGYKHKDTDGHWTSSPMYHRLDDLAHHPSIAGLVASILVRYFRLVVFVDGSDGKPHIFFADTSSPEVTVLEKKEQMKAWIGAIIGGLCTWLSNLAIQKYEEANSKKMPEPLKKMIKVVGASPLILEVLKTVDVWIGHMMSDVSTSQGIPGIFLSLLKEISVLPIFRNTDFRVWVDHLYYKGDMNLSDWGGVVFTATKKQSLPILINEALVRCFFFVRHLAEELKDKKDFQQVNWNNTIPFKNRTVARMLTISTSTFMAFDVIDAAIRSGGFNANCILRINFVGIGRCAIAVGTDIGMGLKKSRKENERLELKGEQLKLLNAKLFYKQAGAWIEAERTAEALNEVYVIMEKTATEFTETWNEIIEGSERRGVYISKIRENNKSLAEGLLESLNGGF